MMCKQYRMEAHVNLGERTKCCTSKMVLKHMLCVSTGDIVLKHMSTCKN